MRPASGTWKAHLKNAFDAPREGRARKHIFKWPFVVRNFQVSMPTAAEATRKGLWFQNDWRDGLMVDDEVKTNSVIKGTNAKA